MENKKALTGTLSHFCALNLSQLAQYLGSNLTEQTLSTKTGAQSDFADTAKLQSRSSSTCLKFISTGREKARWDGRLKTWCLTSLAGRFHSVNLWLIRQQEVSRSSVVDLTKASTLSSFCSQSSRWCSTLFSWFNTTSSTEVHGSRRQRCWTDLIALKECSNHSTKWTQQEKMVVTF